MYGFRQMVDCLYLDCVFFWFMWIQNSWTKIFLRFNRNKCSPLYHGLCCALFSERLVHEVRQKCRSIEGKWWALCAHAWSSIRGHLKGPILRHLTLALVVKKSSRNVQVCVLEFSKSIPAKIIRSPPVQIVLLVTEVGSIGSIAGIIVYTSSTSTFLHTDVLHVCRQTSASPVEAWTSALSTHCLQEECARAVRWAVIEVIKSLGPNWDDCVVQKINK